MGLLIDFEREYKLVWMLATNTRFVVSCTVQELEKATIQ